MRVGIHQPMYIPWLGLFDRISRCDRFILLDNVQYSKNYFLNRNKIKTANGWIWLTVPVLTKGNFGQNISEVEIDNKNDWAQKHLKSIQLAYKKAPYYEKYYPFFEETYNRKWDRLAELSEYMLKYIIADLGINTTITKASDLTADGQKEELILNICRETGATDYLSGPDGVNYLDENLWRSNGIVVEFHHYRHPEYPQLHGEFIPQMSIIDLLFNCGDQSLEVLTDSLLKPIEGEQSL